MSYDYDLIAHTCSSQEILRVLLEQNAEIERKDKLITKLGDALDRCDPVLISIQEVAVLVQRAREATR
jgi:hypothetical protein